MTTAITRSMPMPMDDIVMFSLQCQELQNEHGEWDGTEHTRERSDAFLALLATVKTGNTEAISAALTIHPVTPKQAKRICETLIEIGEIQSIGPTIFAKIDLQAQDEFGWTALHYASMSESKGSIETLIALASGMLGEVNVNAKNEKGRTPLHVAARRGHLKLVKQLVEELDADIFETDLQGQTPLHAAVEANSREVIRYLARGVETVDVRDYQGWTPFILACSEGRAEAAEELLNLGADKTAVDIDSNAAWYYAGLKGHYQLFPKLFKGMGDNSPSTEVDRKKRKLNA